MGIKDRYLSSLSEMLTKVEKVYADAIGDTNLMNNNIENLVSIATNFLKSIEKDKVTKINKEVARQLALLPYLSFRLKLYNKKRLDFSRYPAMERLVKILLSFTDNKKIREFQFSQLNQVIMILQLVENKSINFKKGLAYRFLRLFILNVLFKGFCSAGIIADFILNQIIVEV